MSTDKKQNKTKQTNKKNHLNLETLCATVLISFCKKNLLLFLTRQS